MLSVELKFFFICNYLSFSCSRIFNSTNSLSEYWSSCYFIFSKLRMRFIILRQDATILCNCSSCLHVISSHHSNSNLCSLASSNRLSNIISQNISNTNNSDQNEVSSFHNSICLIIREFIMILSSLVYLKILIAHAYASQCIFAVSFDDLLNVFLLLLSDWLFLPIFIDEMSAKFEHDVCSSLRHESLSCIGFPTVI